MTSEQLLLVIFGIIIVLLIFLVFIMWIRIQQLLKDVERMEQNICSTTADLDLLSHDVEEIKKLKIQNHNQLTIF
jgi:cell division protein FtsL